MSIFLAHFRGINRVGFAALVIASIGILLSIRASAQVFEEEHARHHPGQVSPSPGASPAQSPGPGMMEGMGEMMRGMHGTPPKEIYPSLMALPTLSVQQREQVEQQAEERIRGGNSLMVDAVDALARGAASQDYAAMHEATVKLHEGMTQLNSGIAARRALAEGRAPPEVALEWFKREMSLPISSASSASVGLFGNMQFHILVITILGAFAAVMIFMYFYKMRRAAHLLQELTGGAPSTPLARSITPAPAIKPTSASPVVTAPPVTQPATTKKWAGKLRVGRIFQEKPDVKTFRLMNPLGGPLPFTYLPGQFITVALAPDNQPVKRSYTIASSPTQHDHVEITVKHENEGIVSGFLHNRVKEGDLLDFSGPSGFFTFTGRECKCILLIGGGVGITPLMSVLRYLTDRSWPGDIFLLYCIKTPRDIIFREELDYLQRRNPNLRVVITVSRPEGTDWKGPIGRITKELIVQTVPDVASRYVHICGPVPMMEVAKKMLIELGVPSGRMKTEAFGPALGKPEPILPTVPTAPLLGSEISLPTVTFSVSDKSAPLPPDKVILDVADEIGVEIDNSCRVGTCGTCRVKLLSGQVTMAVEDGLEPGDKERGMILACQAKATANVEVEA
jgi:ferredoxin-NADP reductase